MNRYAVVDCLYKLSSNIVLFFFMSTLFVLSLWHNLLASHLLPKKFHNENIVDPRDVRGSKTMIRPKKKLSSSSISSQTPLQDEQQQQQDNIHYDDRHSITENDVDSHHTITTSTTPNPFDNFMEDMNLVPDIKYYYKQYHIEIEEFTVETDDGFILDLWHMKPSQDTDRTCSGPPILLLHGLLQSSGSFASSGRNSIAYYLYDNGLDVWLANNRCGFVPKWDEDKVNETASEARTTASRVKWDWDLTHMVKYDLKAHITFVLKHTGFDKLNLVAHSQGTTQTLMGLVNGETLYENDPDGFLLQDKLENFVALAPAIYPGPLLDERIFVKFMSKGIDSNWVFGNRSFIPMMMTMRSLMVGTKLFSFLSYIMFNYLFDWNDVLWDRRLRNRHFLFSPVNISAKLMQWWLSTDPRRISFKKNFQIMFPDKKIWFPVKPSLSSSSSSSSSESLPADAEIHLNKDPKLDAKEYPHIMFFIPRQDRLVNGERLINHFIGYEDSDIYKIWYIDEYSHLDVLWAQDVIDRIAKPLLQHLRKEPVS